MIKSLQENSRKKFRKLNNFCNKFRKPQWLVGRSVIYRNLSKLKKKHEIILITYFGEISSVNKYFQENTLNRKGENVSL